MITLRNRLVLALAFSAIVLLVLLAGVPWTAHAVAQTPDAHGYFYFRPGTCTVGPKAGQGVIDTRNGNMWCLPLDGDVPKYEGTLYVLGIPERAPAAKQ